MEITMTLQGKNALITGGKRKIGRGIALALAEAGCNVGINDLERDADVEKTLHLIQKMKCKTTFLQANISESKEVDFLFSTFLNEFGNIDILVNNPFSTENQPFLEITEQNWDHTLNVGLKGFFLCSQRAAQAMVEKGTGGNIVSTSSVHATRVWTNDTCYGVSKAGILRLTKSMATELGLYGIRCNAILPGHINTDHVFGTNPPIQGSLKKNQIPLVPLQRPGTPEDIGRAVVFLCSPAAGNITGISLPIDGGFLTTAGWPC